MVDVSVVFIFDEENFEAGCDRREIFGVELITEWGTIWTSGDERGVGNMTITGMLLALYERNEQYVEVGRWEIGRAHV